MPLILKTEHFAEMQNHCASAYPEEACGALVGIIDGDSRLVDTVLPLENDTTQTKTNRFSISPRDLLSLSKLERLTGMRTLGFFHSHPDHPAVPSETDRAAAWAEYSYPIFSVVEGKVADLKSWRLREDGSGYDPEVVEIDG